jgi:hypothetical protein
MQNSDLDLLALGPSTRNIPSSLSSLVNRHDAPPKHDASDSNTEHGEGVDNEVTAICLAGLIMVILCSNI